MKSSNIFKSTVVFASLLINLSSAQSGGLFGMGINISQNCQKTVESFIGDKELSACFPFLTFASSYIFPGGKNSTEDPYVSQVNSLCSLPKCNAKIINDTLTKFNTGCAGDLASKNTIASAVQGFISVYSPYRDALCLKNSTGDGFCVIETKNAILNYTKTANSTNSTNYRNVSDVLNNIPSETLCTNCNKGLLTILLGFEKNYTDLLKNPLFSSFSNQEPAVKDALANKCGESFLDGSTSKLNVTSDGNISVPSNLASNSTANSAAAAPFGGVRSSYLVGIVSLIISFSLF
ncbi:2128_t:CDS:1 [Ambispora gerdemannii]|uniref:2128_t:CDS:1 n=1 Tax=Ambispora gerdemannii TaxID=144530 RepID=A0A9N9GZE6_9GLOM|nr:2128_t:CDS:1 [Ambispora gerdemannii]